MVFYIQKRLWHLRYICVCHNRLTFYLLRHQNFRRLTFKIASLWPWSSVGKPIFAVLPFLIAASSLSNHNVISSNEFMEDLQVLLRHFCRDFDVFLRFYVTQAKLRSWTLMCIWFKCRWLKRNFSFKSVFPHCCSDSDNYAFALSQSRICYRFQCIILKWSITWHVLRCYIYNAQYNSDGT